MIEIGHFATCLALGLACIQAIIPLIGAQRNAISLMLVGDITAYLQALCLIFAFISLINGFVISDFSIANVAHNSHSEKPLIFKIAASWGSHEGSLLLWIVILALFGAALAYFGTNVTPHLKARTLAIQAWLSVAFLLFLLLLSNPFARLTPPPLEGSDLNPLLQDIGLAFHPPILYVGYVGFSLVFSFAIAGLLEGKITPAWARWVRPWVLVSWLFLTLGIGIGSFWAYYELGWGGWWFWDPVENVSFMPWLLGCALLHSVIITEKRGALKSWSVLLALLTFSLALLGTFIVRSGLLTSVHAFALDPERGIYLLIILALAIGGGLGLFAYRAPHIDKGGLFSPISRESALLMNNLLLCLGASTVFIGTLYPFLLEAITNDKISVGPPFYTISFVPLTMPMIALMGIAPHLNWKKSDLYGLIPRLSALFALSFLLALMMIYLNQGGPILAIIPILLAFWLILSTISDLLSKIKARLGLKPAIKRLIALPAPTKGMVVAHLGLAVAIFGFVGSTLWQDEKITFIQQDQTISFGNYHIRLESVKRFRQDNYITTQGKLTVFENNRPKTTLYPERRYYPIANQTTTETAIWHRLAGDLFLSLSEANLDNNGGDDSQKMLWHLRVLFNPFISFIWLGVMMIAMGGLISLTHRNLYKSHKGKGLS